MTYFKIKDLKRADYNPRTMPEAEMQSLMKSIETHGFVEPIVVNVHPERHGVIVGGHQRLTAIEKLIAKGVIPKGIVSHETGIYEIPTFHVELTLEAEKQLNIGLNKIHGKFDEDKLYSLILDMKGSPTLPTTGFSEEEISSILDRNIDNEENEEKSTDSLQGDARSKLGEIYELGSHKLICGDATDMNVWNQLMKDTKADIVFTSPPYNAGKEVRIGADQQKYDDYNDETSPEDWKKMVESSLVNSIAFSKYQFFNIQQISGNKISFLEFLYDFRDHFVDMSIWCKPVTAPALARNVMSSQFEYVAIFNSEKNPSRSINTAPFHGTIPNVYFGGRQYNNEFSDIHSATFPSHLPSHFVRSFTKRGAIVLDPFAGTGSTMVACERLGRSCYMIELNPKYCDVIRDRWERINKAKQDP